MKERVKRCLEENPGLIIKGARLALGMSQEELARELGVSASSVWHWEMRHWRPKRLMRGILVDWMMDHIEKGELDGPPEDGDGKD